MKVLALIESADHVCYRYRLNEMAWSLAEQGLLLEARPLQKGLARVADLMAAREAGIEVRTGRFPFSANGKAIAMGETQGFVKTVFDATTGELVGAHMAGAEVTELIHGFVLAMNLEATEAALMETIYPHPTLSEMLHESVLAAYGRALNI